MKQLFFSLTFIMILVGCSGGSEKIAKENIEQYVENEDVDSFRKVSKQYPSLKHARFGRGGYTLLQIASKYNYKTEIIEDLLKAEVNINATDLGGDTALHSVCRTASGKINIITLLIKNGAKVNIKNNDNQTPLDMAFKSIDSLENTFRLAKGGMIENYPTPSKGEQIFWRKRIDDIMKLLRSHGGKTGAELAE